MKLPDGRFRVDASGRAICWNWNRDPSGCSDVCAGGRSHVFEWCRSDKHRSCQCPSKPPGWTPDAT